MLKALLILPVSSLILIPCLILLISGFSLVDLSIVTLFPILLLFFIGLWLSIWTMVLFHKTGSGTFTHWQPINTLITWGPYAYVRHPMMIGASMILLSEVLLFQNWWLFFYTVLFIVINLIYFKVVEEVVLENRFGLKYIIYRGNVPFILPRFTPWNANAPIEVIYSGEEPVNGEEAYASEYDNEYYDEAVYADEMEEDSEHENEEPAEYEHEPEYNNEPEKPYSIHQEAKPTTPISEPAKSESEAPPAFKPRSFLDSNFYQQNKEHSSADNNIYERKNND